jgi:hypothetical protein
MSWSSKLNAQPLLQPIIRSMAYNNQSVFLRTSPSMTLPGAGKREGVLRPYGLSYGHESLINRLSWLPAAGIQKKMLPQPI